MDPGLVAAGAAGADVMPWTPVQGAGFVFYMGALGAGSGACDICGGGLQANTKKH